MNVINKKSIKSEFMSNRILAIVSTFFLALMFSISIYSLSYLQVSYFLFTLTSAFVIGIFTFFYFLINTANKDINKKDEKLLMIMVLSFVFFIVSLFPIIRSIATHTLYSQIESSIIRSYDGKSPKTENYANFKKDKENNNFEKINYYDKNREELLSIDTNMVMNLMLVKENIKDLTIKNKLNEMYSDKLISVNEYKDFKEYILNNSNNDDILAQLVSR